MLFRDAREKMKSGRVLTLDHFASRETFEGVGDEDGMGRSREVVDDRRAPDVVGVTGI